MIQLLYFLTLGFALLYFGKVLLLNRRKAILIGLTFTTFSLPALPWQFLPFQNVGVALNLVFVAVAFFYVFMNGRVLKKAVLSKYNILILILGALLFLFTIGSQSQEYGLTKSSFFTFKIVVPVLAFSMMAPFSDNEKRLVLYTLVVASLLTSLALFSFTSWNASALYSRATVAEELNPITVSRTVGIGTVLLFLFGFNFRSGRWKYFVVLLLGVVTVFAVVATGSRGPLLSALFASVIVLVLLNVGVWSKVSTALKLGSFVGLLLFVYVTTDLDKKLEDVGGYQRITMYLTESGRNTSDIERIKRLRVAWDGFVDSKGVGLGTGGFSAIYGYRVREYPHNLFLEVAVELGTIGLLIVFAILAIVFTRIMRVRRESERNFYIQGLFGLWLYSLFNSMVSTDIHGNQALWVFGCLIILFTTEYTRSALRQGSKNK